MNQIIFIIGVTGSGKTTVGRLLSEKTGISFFDADNFHTTANIKKMQGGTPLTDDDRAQWLENINRLAREQMKLEGAIIACSALKENYRSILRNGVDKVVWILLEGGYSLIYNRMKKRKGHYMPPELLQSQFDILEVPDYGLHVNVKDTPEKVVETIIDQLRLPGHDSKTKY